MAVEFYRRSIRLEVQPVDAVTRLPLGPPVVTLSNVDDDGLRIAFNVKRTNEPEPDQAMFRVWNLAATTRQQITELFEAFDLLTVKIVGGYVGFTEVIYFGDVWRLQHQRNGAEVVTEIGTGDGHASYRDGRMNQAFAAGVPVDTVRKLVEAGLGLKPGADAEGAFAQALSGSKIAGGFSNGFVAVGKAADMLTEITAAVGVKWWIRDGKIVYVPATQATNDVAIVLNPGSGLLSHTEPREFGDVEFTALLNPKIFPGRQVILQNGLGIPIDGTPHRVDVSEYTGDTHGQEWFVRCVARHASLI